MTNRTTAARTSISGTNHRLVRSSSLSDSRSSLRQRTAARMVRHSRPRPMPTRLPGSPGAYLNKIVTAPGGTPAGSAASRAFRTCTGLVCVLMTCSCSAGLAGIDVEEFEEPGLQRRGSWDLGRAGSAGGHESQAGQCGEDEAAGGLGWLSCP